MMKAMVGQHLLWVQCWLDSPRNCFSSSVCGWYIVFGGKELG